MKFGSITNQSGIVGISNNIHQSDTQRMTHRDVQGLGTRVADIQKASKAVFSDSTLYHILLLLRLDLGIHYPSFIGTLHVLGSGSKPRAFISC